jgi:peptidoglycan/xylan/chitin deacetylase (PgdA/CDA1 family)
MDRNLAHFADILQPFNIGPTLPLTTAALARSRGAVEKYQSRNIEFAVHGYYHIDHSRLSLEEQVTYLVMARQTFSQWGVKCSGFRCPYLRWNADTMTALSRTNFHYDSSQGLAWAVTDGLDTGAYGRALTFYGALSAAKYPSLPRWENGLVRIPYCLPDDEALIERFRLKAADPMNKLWVTILEETYRLGELFTLGLHPERIFLCEAPLLETLRRARESSPCVWITRLNEIAQWWKARTNTSVTVTDVNKGEFHISVNGPQGVTVLARGVELMTSSSRWDGVYRRVDGTRLTVRAAHRPFIGVTHSSSPYLISFLRQQGYIVEQTENGHPYAFYLDRPRFDYEGERPLLAQIEQGDFPLVRLGRWPQGARSALCVTGDIDAMTLWDYGLRFLGN